MSKKRFSIYGNCQAAALATHLLAYPRFAEEYDYVPLQPNFAISEAEIRQWVQCQRGELDLVVAQHLAPGWHGDAAWDVETVAQTLKPGRPLLRYTDIYYRGVDPLLAYPRSFPRPAHCDYVDLVSLTLASLGFADAQLCMALHQAPTLLEPHEIEAIHTLAEAELQRRESGLEIQVAHDISSLCRQAAAFHTFNHPSNKALDVIAKRILDAVGLGDAAVQWPANEHLSTVRFPLSASTRQAYMHTAADAPPTVRMERGGEVALQDYFEMALSALADQGPARLLQEVEQHRADPISGLVIGAVERALANRLAMSPAALREVGHLNVQGITPDFVLTKADPQAVGFMVDLLAVIRSTLLPRLGGTGATVLDLGAKSGAGSALMAYLGQPASFSKMKFSVTCADIDPAFRDYSLARHPHVEYLNADAFAVGRQWDIVLCSHVVEHVPDPLEFVGRLRSIARHHVVLAFPYTEDPASLTPGHVHSLGHDFLRALKPCRYEIYDGLFWSQSLCCIAVIDVHH